jgi:crotonobetainyl-CoA:carnitine CoA-transferase CaiB-like acyl-CoA transferase
VDHGAPEGSYQCADGEWVYFALGDPLVNIPKLLRLIGRPELVDDIRFTPENRWENRYELHGCLQDAFLQKPVDEWVRLADEYDVPLVRVMHFKEVAEDPQAWANGYLERVSFPNGHEDTVPTSPVQMDSVGTIKMRPAPPCGADTADVLRQLGYSDGQIVEMKENGAIGTIKKN